MSHHGVAMSGASVGSPDWTIGQIAMRVAPVTSATHGRDVIRLLDQDPSLPAVAVSEDGTLLGLAGRNRLLRTFANPLHQAVFERRPIALLTDHAPMIVDAREDVDTVTERIARDHPQALDQGFLILDGDGYLGIGNAHHLLELTTAKARQRIGELDSARKMAVAASEAKSTFLARMSHEFRTPLNAIIGFSELLAHGVGGKLGTRHNEYVGDILRSGHLLLELVNDVLDLSSIEADKIELREERVPLSQIASDCVRLITPRAAGKHQVVTLDCPDPVDMRGDARRVQQVMINLLSNAVKYTGARGAIDLKVDIDGQGRPGFCVTDNGIGIAPEDIERVLNPFSRIENAYTRDIEGTGIGLPLARLLVERHGGTLTLQSRLKVGTRVTVRFPQGRLMALQGASRFQSAG